MEIKHGEKRVEEKERGLQWRKCFDKIGKQKQGGLCACHYQNSQGSEGKQKREKQLKWRTGGKKA